MIRERRIPCSRIGNRFPAPCLLLVLLLYYLQLISPVKAASLRVKFDDGQEREIDFRPVLTGELYGPLKDDKLFSQVSIDPEIHTLVWPNGADFDPETLHEWPKYVQEIKRIASQSKVEEISAI